MLALLNCVTLTRRPRAFNCVHCGNFINTQFYLAGGGVLLLNTKLSAG